MLMQMPAGMQGAPGMGMPHPPTAGPGMMGMMGHQGMPPPGMAMPQHHNMYSQQPIQMGSMGMGMGMPQQQPGMMGMGMPQQQPGMMGMAMPQQQQYWQSHPGMAPMQAPAAGMMGAAAAGSTPGQRSAAPDIFHPTQGGPKAAASYTKAFPEKHEPAFDFIGEHLKMTK